MVWVRIQSGQEYFYWDLDTQKVQWNPPKEPFLKAPLPPTCSPPSQVFYNGQKWWKLKPRREDLEDILQTFKLLLAGGGAGAIAKTAVAPLERIKMLCQVYGLEHPGKSASMRQVISTVYGEAGILGFWSGNFANVIRIIPNKGILFMCNDKYKQLAGLEPNQPAQPIQILAAGSMSGVTTTVLTYPLDLVRSRLMMSGGNYKGVMDCMSKTVRMEGWTGLYAGMGPTIAGIMPYAGINFMCYDAIKRWAQENMGREDGTLAAPVKLSIGAVSGMVSQTASYPIDTVRRRMQLQGTKAKIYKNSFDCFAMVLRREGPIALYRGLVANVIRAGPNAAIQFLAYEQLAKALGLNAL